MKKNKNWLQKAINPKHKGYCTPITKKTCTEKRKAFAMTMKEHHGFHKKYEKGGKITNGLKESYSDLISDIYNPNETFYKF